MKMISIAMATYNGEKYLKEQLDSILAQTIQNFELVVCDDCSSDSTVQILNKYAKKDSRIKVFVNEKNLGFRKNFEKAIGLCSGEYIALSDQDDVWKSNHLEYLVQNIKDKGAAVGNSVIMNFSGELTGKLLSDGDGYFVDGDDCSRLIRILFYGSPFQGTSSMYSKKLLEKALPIPSGVVYHDAWFAACACCSKGLNYSFNVITNYRIHGNNASGNHQKSFLERIVFTLNRKGFKTDRLIYCEELLKRFPNMNSQIKKIILEASNYHKARQNGRKLKAISCIIKNYKKIYSVDNYKMLFSRCIGILLKG